MKTLRSFRLVALGLPLAAISFAACSDGAPDTQQSATAGTAGAAGTAGTATGGKSGSAGTSGTSGNGGSAAGKAGQAGSAGNAGAAAGTTGGTTGQVTCTTVNDCAGTVPVTKPAGCAVAVCDAATKLCKLVAKDFDGDGHATSGCTTTSAAVITLGDDCNDTDPLVFPGAWDGPAGTVKGVAQPNACNDGIDNDCSGTPDDAKTDDGQTCTCTPGDVRECGNDDTGKPVAFPGGSPKGECRLGGQTCLDGGKWGPCTGVVKPVEEICDKKDNDCDGAIDEEDAINRKTWRWDHDGDGHSDPKIAQIVACDPPKTAPVGCVPSTTTICTLGENSWAVGATPDDCNDDDTSVNPAEKEVCDGVDNDCNGQVDEGAKDPIDWFFDADGDGFVTTDAAARKTKASCTNPGLLAENCPPGQTTCPTLWVKQGAAPITDCNDADADVHPGAWDGPIYESRPYGIEPPGLTLELFEVPGNGGIPNLATAKKLATTRTDVQINFDLGKGALQPNVPVDVAARWSGAITVPETGEYTFQTLNDDGVRLFVNDERIINDWNNHGVQTNTGKITLQAGTVIPLKLEWYDASGFGVIVLQWSSATLPLQNLAVRLDPVGGAKPNRCTGGKDWDCSGTPADSHVRLPESTVLDISCAGCDPIRTSPANRLTRACGTTLNAATCHPGSQHCMPNGTLSACAGEVAPKDEVCDGVDNDCDGSTDETFDVNKTCYEGKGACERPGVTVCNAAKNGVVCNAVPGAAQETCGPAIPKASGGFTYDYNCNDSPEPCATSEVKVEYCGTDINPRDAYCEATAGFYGPRGSPSYETVCQNLNTTWPCAVGCGQKTVTFPCVLKASLSGLYCGSGNPTFGTATCK